MNQFGSMIEADRVGPWSMATDTLHPYLFNGKEFNHDSTDVYEDGKNELAWHLS
jgi:hypothetical protein